jgi:hypothetical protein
MLALWSEDTPMKYEIAKDASVPLREDNRASIALKKGQVLDTDQFSTLSKARVAALVRDGVLKKPAALDS